MLGASGAVGTVALNALLHRNDIQQLTLLGRTPIASMDAVFVEQHKINIDDASSYADYVQDKTTAICTLGVGQPTKVSKVELVRIDKTAVLDFAKECKKAGVRHFELLASVGANPKSSSFYLRTKGELIEELKGLDFDRLSIFQPSMIITPTNRYGLSQAITLKVWPLLSPLFRGSLRKYRGVPVKDLGEAIAKNVFKGGEKYEVLQWDDFYAIKPTK